MSKYKVGDRFVKKSDLGVSSPNFIEIETIYRHPSDLYNPVYRVGLYDFNEVLIKSEADVLIHSEIDNLYDLIINAYNAKEKTTSKLELLRQKIIQENPKAKDWEIDYILNKNL